MTITSKFNGRCRKCGGVIHAGEKCDWTRGAGITHVGACPANEAPKNVAVGVGVFRKDGRVYVVKPNQEKTRFYAKEIVESPARMTESGLVVDFETVYRPGKVYDLTENDRWNLADARDFLTKFARCIVCGRHLKAAKSVGGAIGPVCAKYFATTHGAPSPCAHDHANEAGVAHAAPEPEIDANEQESAMSIEAAIASLGSIERYNEQPVELSDDDEYFASREEAADRNENDIIYGDAQ